MTPEITGLLDKAKQKGFTLVEMAIVLVVIGLLVGMGAGMIGPLTTMSKVRESREVVESDITSIIGWAASNNRLPDATTNTATYFTNALKSVNDTWGNPVYYLYSCPFGEGAASAYCTDAFSFSKDTICGRKTTSLRIITPTTTIQNVAFVLMSDMYDSVQTTLDGNLTTLIGGTITTTAVPNTVITRSGAVSPRVGTLATITLDANNSDIVRWVTLDELRSKIGCQGAQLKIVNNELPYGYVGSSYPSAGNTLSISVDGGATPSTYRWCIESPSTTYQALPHPLPNGLTFTGLTQSAIRFPNIPAPNNSSCIATNPLVESNWYSSATLTLSTQPLTNPFGTIGAGTQGSYSFTIYVRDNGDTSRDTLPLPNDADNIASKTFVLTINP